MKKEKQEKRAELHEKKAKIEALKAEAKKCRREIKSLNKNIKFKKKKEKKQPELDCRVVGHLNMDLKSAQQPGTNVCKTWKVVNTGKEEWKDGEVTVEFFKGDFALVVDGFQIMQVENTKSCGAAFINAMIQVPSVPGRYLVVYQMKHNGVRFGEKLRTVIFVKPEDKLQVVEEERGVIEDFQEEDIPYVPLQRKNGILTKKRKKRNSLLKSLNLFLASLSQSLKHLPLLIQTNLLVYLQWVSKKMPARVFWSLRMETWNKRSCYYFNKQPAA